MTKQSNDSPALAPQKFVSKPVTKWAIKFDGSHDGARRIIDWVNAENPRFDPNDSGTWTVSGYYGTLTIRTLEGDMEAVSGDWIIKGIKGEFYPCKPDIFKDSYSPALSEPAAPSKGMDSGEPSSALSAHDLRNCPAMRALVSLTPGGSEFVDDIPRCVENIRSFQKALMKALVREKKLLAGAESGVPLEKK